MKLSQKKINLQMQSKSKQVIAMYSVTSISEFKSRGLSKSRSLVNNIHYTAQIG